MGRIHVASLFRIYFFRLCHRLFKLIYNGWKLKEETPQWRNLSFISLVLIKALYKTYSFAIDIVIIIRHYTWDFVILCVGSVHIQDEQTNKQKNVISATYANGLILNVFCLIRSASMNRICWILILVSIFQFDKLPSNALILHKLLLLAHHIIMKHSNRYERNSRHQITSMRYARYIYQ